MFTYIFLGIAAFQMLFIGYQYVLLRRIEFLYYFFYTFFITVFVVGNLLPQYNPFPSLVTAQSPFTLNRGLVIISYGFYFQFGRHFINAKTYYPNKVNELIWVARILFVAGIIDVITQLLGWDYIEADLYIRWVLLATMVYCVYILIYLISRSKKIITNILIVGSCMLVVGMSVGFIDILFISKKIIPPEQFLGYAEAGIIGEFLFLTFGLVYKTKMMQDENVILLKEQHEEVSSERRRIVADLHDEVGGGLSTIRILSDLIINNAGNKEMIETYAPKISNTTKEITDKMKAIIWSLDEENDTVENLFEYLRQYGFTFFENSTIIFNCETKMETAGTVPLQGIKRKNIFLIVKEALTNIQKHSKAKNVLLSLFFLEKGIKITIADDGTGIIDEKKFSNGIKNMNNRSQQLNGTLSFQNKNGLIITVNCTI